MNKKAFSLAEVLTALVIMGALILITISNAVKQAPDSDKAKFKKAYMVIEKNISSMLNDDALYPDDMGFMNLAPATTELGDTFGVNDKRTKFRDAFKYLVTVTKDNLTCQTLVGEQDTCFMSDDGIVYGIPDTDFVSAGMYTNPDDNKKYVPITFYTNWDKITQEGKRNLTEGDMQDYAFFMGIRYNGQIKALHSQECQDTTPFHCKTEEFLMADNIKKGGH